MKKTGLIFGILIVLSGYVFFSCKQKLPAPQPEQQAEKALISNVGELSKLIDELKAAASNNTVNAKQLQALFISARLYYKKIEWATEYFTPNITRYVNGPPVPEVEMQGTQVFDSQGFQVIENYLFPKQDTTKRKKLLQQLTTLQTNCTKYKVYFSSATLYNWQIFDAAKLEVFRILTLGVTGFDSPLALNNIAEASVSLQSVGEVLSPYSDNSLADSLQDEITAASRYLNGHRDFNSFNRAEFITGYGNPITTSITLLEKQLNIPVVKYNRLLNQDAKTLFDKNAYNVNAYTPGFDYLVNAKRIALGKLLFSDAILSGNKNRSCASCHQADKAFTDGLVKNTLLTGHGLVRRNTPTLINSALQPSQFYDLRSNTLEDQAMDVVQNKDEMHGTLPVIQKRLWNDQKYRNLFTTAYPVKDRTAIDTLEITNAIGSYIRSLTLLNSCFDDYMRGNKAAMNQHELNGFNLFMGKAKCGTCHYMPLFNGTLPPKYIKIESEVIGVPATATGKQIDADKGRYDVSPIDPYLHAFKITTIRNAALTAPYMHNGVFTTLKQVIDFYNKGGGQGQGIKISNQTLDATELHLSPVEIADLIAFIKSLNSRQ